MSILYLRGRTRNILCGPLRMMCIRTTSLKGTSSFSTTIRISWDRRVPYGLKVENMIPSGWGMGHETSPTDSKEFSDFSKRGTQTAGSIPCLKRLLLEKTDIPKEGLWVQTGLLL